LKEKSAKIDLTKLLMLKKHLDLSAKYAILVGRNLGRNSRPEKSKRIVGTFLIV
jgi:hypothetical protein